MFTEYYQTLLVLIIGCFCYITQAQVWSKRPVTVYACPGDDASFPWGYHPGIARDVTMVYWRHVNTSRTVLVHQLSPMDTTVVYRERYRNRVGLMPLTEANAGFILKDVQPEDAGQYKVELVGTVFSDVASLNVVKDSDLDTSIYIDGEPTKISSTVTKIGAVTLKISVMTNPLVEASVLIATNDRSFHCVQSTSCNTTLSVSSQPLVTVTVAVYYGICEPREYTVYIQTVEGVTPEVTTSPPLPPSPRNSLKKGHIAAIVIVTVLVLCLAVAIILWVLLYKKKSKGYVLKPWQRKYVGLKVFIPLKKSNCFEDSSTRARSPSKISRATVDDDVGSSFRGLDREGRTFTKEDITVVYEDTPTKTKALSDEVDGDSYSDSNQSNDDDDDQDYSDGEYDVEDERIQDGKEYQNISSVA